MKHYVLLLLAIATLATSCKKITAPGPFTVTTADFDLNYKPGGAVYYMGNIDLAVSVVTVPTASDNQSWDVSGFTIKNATMVGPFVAPNKTDYPSSTFGLTSTTTFGLGALSSPGVPSVQYYEVSNSGFYNLGTSTLSADALSIPSIGGTLAFPVQNIGAGSNKYQLLTLPAAFGTQSTQNNIVRNSNFIANAPPVGVINTPGQARRTNTVTNNVFAAGKITLRGYGTVRVLVNKATVVEQLNYFLGGAPAPAPLLAILGLVDGATSTKVFYDYYAEGLGLVGSITCDATGTVVTKAQFRFR